MFDLPTFLDQQGIDYATSGKNANRDNIRVSCPFCGDDPSHHLGISLLGKGYFCRRNNAHRGKSPIGLIVALIGCSYDEAARIADLDNITFATTDDSFSGDLMRSLGFVDAERPVEILKLGLLDEFRPIQDDAICRTLVFPYLMQRRYSASGVLQLADRYELMFANSGKFSYRIIIPVKVRGDIVNMDRPDDRQERRSPLPLTEHGPAEGREAAVTNRSYEYQRLLVRLRHDPQGRRYSVVSEGPFDAMRLGFLGEPYDIRATCLFSKSASQSQLDLLRRIVPRYRRVVSMFDQNADFDAFAVFPEELRLDNWKMPRGVGDPAEAELPAV